MSATPGVSVVIATYNYGHYIERCLDSVLAQSYSDYEVIVVDDGSTDDTPAIVNPYVTDHGVQYVRVEHVGVSAAKNIGMRKARGRYLALLDSDDEWLPDKLHRQVEVLDSQPQTVLVYTRRSYIDTQDRILGIETRPLYRGAIVQELFLDNFVCYSSVMVRRNVLEEVGYLDESIIHPSDFDLWLRIAVRYSFDYIDAPLTRYRHHPSISRTANYTARRLEIDRVEKRFLTEYGGSSLIRPKVLRLAEVRRLCQIGYFERDKNVLRALGCYVKALAKNPAFGPAWYGVAAVFTPERIRRTLRRVLSSHPRTSTPCPPHEPLC